MPIDNPDINTKMEAKSTDKKTFQLTENGHLLGELVYENLFSHKAGIRVAHTVFYDLNPIGIFGTSIAVEKNGAQIASLAMNWRGQIVFSFQNGEEFLFKATGLFSSKYIIENKDGEKLLLLDPRFNWSQFSYNYNISYDKKPQDILLVLLGVYAANYFIASMSGYM